MRRLLVAAAAISAVGLSGCVEIKSDSASQQQAIGSVRVTTVVCPSSEPDQPPCPSNGAAPDGTNSQIRPSGRLEGQLLVAYRIPSAAGPPATITLNRPGSGPGHGTLTLAASPTYAAQLTAVRPPGAGLKWAGYLSTAIFKDDQLPGENFTLTGDFDLLRGSDGSPFPSATFTWRTVTGFRTTYDTPSRTRPVVCAGDGTQEVNDYHPPGSTEGTTVCIDSPRVSALSSYRTVAVKDVGVLNGGTVTAQPGQAISVPFQVKSVGSGLPVMNLSAGTTAPAAVAMSGLPQIQPNGSTQSVPVSVDVASNTPPGSYDVTLAATTVNGQQLRMGRWTLEVPAPANQPQPQPQPQQGDGKPPVVSLALAGKLPRLRTALKKGLKFTATCDEACSALLTVKKGTATLGTGKANEPAPGGSYRVTVKFSRKARKKYANAKKLKLSALLAVKDGAGLTGTATRTLTLKP